MQNSSLYFEVQQKSKSIFVEELEEIIVVTVYVYYF